MRINLAALVVGTTLVAACNKSADTTSPNQVADAPVVLSLSPTNAAVGVSPTAPIVITFNHAMMQGMEALVLLHEGGVSGPVIAGTGMWSANRMTLTLTPLTPLKAHTTYIVHLSPSLAGSDDHPIDLAACTQLGGQYVTNSMMGLAPGAGMMNGSWGPGMMGDGWRSPDGTYGMFFTFTTA